MDFRLKRCNKCGNYGHIRRQCNERNRMQGDMNRVTALNMTMHRPKNETILFLGDYILTLIFVNVCNIDSVIVKVSKDNKIVFYKDFRIMPNQKRQ
jgi:hypothetical protein